MTKESNNMFKLSNLMPNSWFNKLKSMQSQRKRAQKHHDYSTFKSQISKTEALKSPTIQHYHSNRISYYIPSQERATNQLPLSPTHPTKSTKVCRDEGMIKKRLAESFVLVKSSLDPKRDFGESMVDMIVENKFCAWEELEELLACYLLLNSSEFHDMIVDVFEEILFDLYEIIV